MTRHIVSPFVPALIDDERFNRNGFVPHEGALRRLANGFNVVAARQKRQVFLRSLAFPDAPDQPATGIFTQWPFFFRTGENTTELLVALGQALVLDPIFGSSASGNLRIRKHSDGTTVALQDLHFTGLSAETAIVPARVHHSVSRLTGLEANADYYGQITLAGGGRVVYMGATEGPGAFADDSVTGICSPAGYLGEAPIYDADQQELIEANNLLWQHNGAHLLHWSEDYFDDAPTISGTTYANVVDGTTSVAASSVGQNIFTQYHNTVNRSTVPVRYAVMAYRTAGAGSLSVRLTDGTNNLDFTGITTGGVGDWYVTTGTVPPQGGTKWDLHAKVSAGGTTFKLYAVALQEWES